MYYLAPKYTNSRYRNKDKAQNKTVQQLMMEVNGRLPCTDPITKYLFYPGGTTKNPIGPRIAESITLPVCFLYGSNDTMHPTHGKRVV
jgi:hypothetical protein